MTLLMSMHGSCSALRLVLRHLTPQTGAPVFWQRKSPPEGCAAFNAGGNGEEAVN